MTGLSLLTTDNQRVTADTSGNNAVSSNDAGLVARYVSGLGATGITGTWRFFVPPGPTFPVGASPTSRNYPTLTGDISGEDYIGLLIGDVTGNWMNVGPRPAKLQKADAENSGPVRDIAVELPSVVSTVDKEVVVPVNVQGVAYKGVISYELDVRYDPTVIQPHAVVADLSGSISSGLVAVVNTNEPGLLRVVVYGPLPINEDGLLLNLRFMSVGNAGSASPLIFERMMFNEGEARVAVTDGLVQLY